jgi:predicted PurR-regulated permease PerM
MNKDLIVSNQTAKLINQLVQHLSRYDTSIIDKELSIKRSLIFKNIQSSLKLNNPKDQIQINTKDNSILNYFNSLIVSLFDSLVNQKLVDWKEQDNTLAKIISNDLIDILYLRLMFL